MSRRAKLCRECRQPMLPAGVVKLPDHYDHASGCPLAPKDQLDLLASLEARDRALEDVASTAGTGTWINLVLDLIRSMPTGRCFTTDHLWTALTERPPEARAMGAALTAARREGLAIPTGHYMKSERVVNHARPLAEWMRR